jgi:hypothetical protein
VYPARALGLALALAACSGGSTAPSPPVPSPGAAETRVVNASGAPLLFFAVASDLAPLLDPVPELAVAEHQDEVVPPGGERPVGELSGREQAPDGGVAVYLYAITADGTRARFTRVQLVSGDEIRRNGGRIVVRKL